MHGALFLVVGPSGVGKDTLLDGARARLGASSSYSFPRRVITRPADAGGEDHIPATEAEFRERLAAGAFLHHWGAHGLYYGILAGVADELAAGVNVVINTSRNELSAFRDKVTRAIPVYISASPEVVAARLRARGRETEEEIAGRLARITRNPSAAGALEVLNDGTVEEGIAVLVDLITGAASRPAELREVAEDQGHA